MIRRRFLRAETWVSVPAQVTQICFSYHNLDLLFFHYLLLQDSLQHLVKHLKDLYVDQLLGSISSRVPTLAVLTSKGVYSQCHGNLQMRTSAIGVTASQFTT